jgi:hypothetical protein
MKTCKIESCNNKIWSNGLCKNHIVKKPMVKKISSSAESTSEMQNFFLYIWKKKGHYSEVSGDYLGKEPLTIFFHHILSKEKYPEARMDEENIIILTADEHNNVENDMYKYEEVNNRRNNLKTKYNL